MTMGSGTDSRMLSHGNGHRPMPPDAVLVPLDGSALAEEALPVAVNLAQRGQAVLHLVAVQVPSAAAPLFRISKTTTRRDQGIRRSLQQYLASTAESLSAAHGLRVVWAIQRGQPAVEVDAYARAHRVGLVVMTTHGRGGLSRLWLGSVADQLLRRTAAPVLLLRPGRGAGFGGAQRILVGLDGSEQAEEMLESAIALGAITAQASYLLTLVIEPPLAVSLPTEAPLYIQPDWPEPQRGAAERYLRSLARRLGEQGLEVRTCVRIGDDVARQLVALAQETQSTLIALAAHGARGVERLLLGSVTDKVIRSAEQPVFVVPPLGARAMASPESVAGAGTSRKGGHGNVQGSVPAA